MHTLFWLLDWLLLPFRSLVYLLDRLHAKPCPYCGERWYTELTCEWDGEDWKCRTCGNLWILDRDGKVTFQWYKKVESPQPPHEGTQ
jgi:hypothetical protein